MSSIDEVGWDPGKETWNGVALAKAAEKDEELPVETTSMPREDGDGASSASSISGKSDGFTKGEDFLHDQTSNPPDVSNWQRDEKLLEELFRLKLNSASPSVASTSVVSGASLPPKQRIKLFQPRTKQEQYEDILIESQLLEASLPEFGVAAFEEAANELGLDLIDGFDYGASDVIFGDTEPTKDNSESIKEKKTEGSSASSSESPLASSVCDCASCRDRRSIEAKETEELERLRKCWLEVREDVWRIYHLVLCDAWKDPNRADEKPDLNLVKEKVKKLVWRDPHQLFTRLESGVREFVLEIKLKLIELLQKQAKNPSLAQDFIQYLLEGYNKLCSAANHVSPALIDLEIEHLRRFSLTWEVLNKHLYQAIIYTDPLIENNLPIFLSQLRSLYPDKEHEARYTELVRGYLDFDVEMVNIASLWKNSEILISEFTQQQNILRAKQRMLKEDWERFKTQRKDLERQMKGKNNDSPTGVEKCSCDVCSIPGIAPLPNSSIYPSLTGDSSCPASTANGRTCSADLSKHYPNLYQTILQSNSTNHIKDHQGLAALFPSLLTVDGPKGPTSASVAAELSQALSTALGLSDENFPVVNPPTESEPVVVDNQNQKCQQEKSGTPDKPATPATPPCSTAVSNDKSETNKSNSSSEINKLLQQHYCSHKNKKKHPVPSASAIRKGKVPPPPSCTLGGGDSTDELSGGSSSLAPDDTCSSGSSMTSHANNGKHCSCCYCEVFGHNTGGGGGQAVAPVSRNYPEMRERLRLLLSKKKKEQARCKQPPGSHQIKSSSIVTSSSGSSSASSSTSSVKSMTPSGNVVKKMANQQPPAVAAEKTTPAPSQLVQPAVNKVRNDSQVKPVAKPATVGQPPPVKPIVPAPQGRSLSASSLAQTVPPQQKLEKSQSAVVPKVNGGIPPAKPTEKELESLLEFIEGNASSANEKKKAKKERQKQQRLEELRAREEEERRRREAEEKERKRREEEERQRQEMERQLLKKQKKKAAQRAKKAIAKGVSPEDLEPEPSVIVKEAAKPNQAVPPAKLTMEELRARQMKELMELQARHQRQIEEEKRKLLESQEAANAQANITQSNKANKRGKKNAKNSRSSDKEGSVGPTSSKPTPTLASVVSKAGPGTQIKITRTASGGVEFTTIPADEPAEKKVPVGFGNLPMGQPAPPPYLQNMMFGQGPPSMQPYLPPPPQPSFMPIQPNQDRPSVPSKAVPSQPMVTIRRVENPEFTEPTVTISTQNGKDSNGKKLLYTLINGQIHRAKDAPDDLIPTAKPLPPEIGKKLLPTDVAKPTMMSRPPPQMPSHPGSGPAMRPPLPTDSEGKLDLNRLQLPPGISITKIQGPVPERKYFPSKPDPDQKPIADIFQNYLPLPGTLGPSRPEISPNIQSSNLLGYSAMAGMPTGMNGPNVIVVEASSLKTREEERKEQEDLKNREEERKSREEDRKDQDAKKKNKKKKAKKDGEQQAVNPQQQRPSSQAGAYPYLMPQIPQIPETNSLKSGPQVLIKNVNGSVVITPIPSNEPSQKVNPKVNAGMNGGAKMPPGSLKPSELECPTLEKPKSSQAHRNCRSSTEENVDDFNSIFVPKDIDLDNGEIDDNDRAVEEFKRFCFDSVPLKQKPKVNFDVKDITFKKK